ncbi:hypothetical protein QFC22_004984 [Naganishia vaughanmartiniae]|uniref:Uncharacterized protein n=1 Tax=Naganishia vaughanmartiniae TaxID=1424756 RepID=A0ACC2WXT8_9TREE|nr:hypothetical protein QFC22_004984 [Naganishia vaughanmartiniae]
MSSSMWAPSNAQELDAARQTPRKTPFADQHAKARDQGFYAPDAASGSGSGRGRSKSGPGRSRKPGGMDGVAMTPDRGSGRASARGKPRGGPNPQAQYHQEPISMATTPIKQSASSSGYGRKTSKDREAIWQSIWGDDSDEEKPKEKAAERKEPIKEEETVVGGKDEESAASTDKDIQQLGDKLANARLATKPAPVEAPPPPAPPAVVIPPPAVISGVDWSELDDDEDLTFLEQVPGSADSSAQGSQDLQNAGREAITTSSSTPSTSTSAASGDAKTHSVHPLGLNVTTANDIADSSHENPPKVNVGQKSTSTSPSPLNGPNDAEGTVDVKLAPEVATRTSQREEAQTSGDLGSENESVTDSSRAGLKSPVESNNSTDGSSLKDSRWATAGARGTANQRGARGGARPPARGSFQQGPLQRNQPFQNNPRTQQQNSQRPLNQNAPRPPAGQMNRGAPTGPRAGHTQPQQNQHRGSGSRNAPPLASNQATQQPQSSGAQSARSSDTSSPVPPSTASASSNTESPSSANSPGPLAQQQQQQPQRGPRQATMQKDSVKRLMNGWIGTAPGGMRRGPSGRGRGRAPAGGEQAGSPATPSAGGVTQ